MNKKYLIGAVLSTFVLSACNQQKAEAPDAAAKPADVALSTEEQQVSYGIGLNFGTNLKRQEFPIDIESFVAGLHDGVDGNEPKMAQAQIMEVMQGFQKKMMEKRKAEKDAEAAKNKEEGEAFLAENGKKEGVVTTESGLQYKVIAKGDGPVPGANDTVEVNYRGTLINGDEFDSSYKRGKPVSFPVKGVIKGWTEALQLMPVGSKYELYIPASLAYGPGGTGSIGPNATLIFEVELLSIKEKKAPEAVAKKAG